MILARVDTVNNLSIREHIGREPDRGLTREFRVTTNSLATDTFLE